MKNFCIKLFGQYLLASLQINQNFFISFPFFSAVKSVESSGKWQSFNTVQKAQSP